MVHLPVRFGGDLGQRGVHVFSAGEVVYRWVWTGSSKGHETYDVQLLKVVRVNHKTVTVETEHGSRMRVDPSALWHDGEAEQSKVRA